MFKYILKRIGLMLMTFSIIMTMLFVLIKLLPITINVTVGQSYDAIYAQLEARGYFDPIIVQFFNYLSRIFLHGDFGVGVNMAEYRNANVLSVFLEKLPPTILINIYSSLIAVPIGLSLGIYAALKKNTWKDNTLSTATMLLISVPSFVSAFIIQYVFCFKLRWFELTMDSGFDYFSVSMIMSMIPAVLSLAIYSIAGYTRGTRAELTEVLTSEFMLLARTKGLTKSQATKRHALRNAMVPIFPSILGEIIGALSGSLIIEKIFSVPGVGSLYLDSINNLDYDFFLFLSGFYTLVGLGAGIIVDVGYSLVDPRVRVGAK